MKHSLKQDLSDKKKRGIMRDEKRTTQVTIPPAYKDEKLALETRIDGSTILNQCARPQNGPGRTFHCSVCNTALKSKSDYEDHIAQVHKKRSRRKDSRRHSTLSATSSSSSKTSIDYDLVTKNKTMNPAKIVDHSGLLYAQNRLIKARYKHQSSYGTRNSSNSKSEAATLSLADSSRATNVQHEDNNAVVADTNICQPATTLDDHRTHCDCTLDPDTSSCRCYCSSVGSTSTAPHHKRRKLSASSDTVLDIELEEQKIQRALSAENSQVEVEIKPIVSNAASCPHPVVNDPNNYCRVCHVSHSTQEAYQVHLQTKHHVVAFPSNKRKPQRPPAVVARPDKLPKCYYMPPIQITFGPTTTTTSSPAGGGGVTTREQIKDASVQPDLDNPNHYCQSCHITKPSRTSYLVHLCMIHQITSRKKKPQM
ncbi:C2H2-type zinc finger transcription factor [Mucor lusitanicus]|uniref:C2H2-type zinc finger transcription factor n=2 Tax=Mucor circinelloides f. lusitanicus TaxID=29924 RepID=A0A168IZ06_MUCCL|nr:C2H2-type zinc finger transcription factor [Mucor lusitanicus]OAD00538.1 C2H2-type zinc finger transcription factor [Mucor lusitanicus CBS 277.49]